MEYQLNKLSIGSPNTIMKILGNALITFLGSDGNLYLIDVNGNVNLVSNYIGGVSGTIVYDQPFLSVAGQKQYPTVPSPKLMLATNTFLYLEGTLLTAGSGSDEYSDTPSLGYVTTNFTSAGDQRFRLVGFTVS